jgi:hypothetical protein
MSNTTLIDTAVQAITNKTIDYNSNTFQNMPAPSGPAFPEYEDRITITGSDMDWSLGFSFYKSVTANLDLTMTNLHIGTAYILIPATTYFITFPSWCRLTKGIFDNTVDNLIKITCTNITSGSEEGVCEAYQSL